MRHSRLPPVALDDSVDDELRHPPPGGELAAGDRQHPRRGLVELGLARDVHRLLRVAGGDQRPHAGVGARDVVGGQLQLQVLVDRVQQVVDVVVAGRHVVDVAVVVVVGRCPISARPYQGRTKIGALLPRRDDARRVADRQVVGRERDVRAAAGRDPRDLLLGQDLVGPDAVGPDAGRVDDVRRPGPRGARPTRPRVKATPAARPSSIEDLGHLGAVQQHRPEALGLAQDRQDEPDVVGLAVVEEVGRVGLERGQRRDQLRGLLAGDRAVAVGRPVLPSSRPCSARWLRPRPMREVAITSYMLRPIPMRAVAARRRPGRGPGTASDRRGAAPGGPSAGAPAAPRGPGPGRSSAGSAARRGPSSRSGWTCPRAKSPRSTSATE